MIIMYCDWDDTRESLIKVDRDQARFCLVDMDEEQQMRINQHLRDSSERVKREFESKIEVLNKLLKDKESRIEQLLKEHQTLETELETQKQLNAGLKRIRRETANADRGITPKKTHHGYILRSMEQYTETMSNYPVWDVSTKVPVWRYVLQTPFSCKQPADTIIGEALNDLTKPWNSISAHVPADTNGDIKSILDHESKVFTPDTVYKWRMKATTATGLWEIEIYTANEIKWSDECYSIGPAKKSSK